MSYQNNMNITDYFNPNIKKFLPYLIAEAGVNHEGNPDIAKRLIDEALEAGADAIKFQTYKAETLASVHSPAYWDLTKEATDSQYKLFKKYDKFWKPEFEVLKKYCDQAGLEFISTPFDTESADFLNPLMSIFKISSSDITNKPFIQYLCDFKKPILLSAGASNLDEIKEAVNWIELKGNKLALMHCVLNYPTDDKNAGLGKIRGLKKEFPEKVIGYSDHTLPKDMKTLETAWLLGAEIIEKHFTHDKTLPGNDHYHAMDKNDLKLFRSRLFHIKELIGTDEVGYIDTEIISRENARRSLVASKKIHQGKIIEYSDLTWKRPAHGISPKYIDEIIGKTATKTIEADEIIKDGCYE
jgi:sialic acid synthase SpsE